VRRTPREILRRRVLDPLSEYVSTEAAGGIALFAATVVALVWANSPLQHAYHELWSHELTLGVGRLSIAEDLEHWVNDGLMAVFFFVVGLEIKRELVCGELRDPKTAALPALAALGGMVVPAGLYAALNASGGGVHGWGIPMATDIAFAVGVLAILGSRVPSSLKLFLLTLAIVDDIGAILVIAVFYSEGIAWAWLGGAVVAVGVIVAMQRLGVRPPLAYVLPALALWVCALESGVHATIAGVVVGVLTPARPFRGRPVIEPLEHRFHPLSSFVIVPLFALANAGVELSGATVRHAAASRVTWGIVVGLVVGKLVGVVGATTLGVRAGIGRMPAGVGRRDVLGAGLLAGIGFTVSLFVAQLAFGNGAGPLDEAKLGILLASLVSGALGAIVLATGRHRTPTGSP